MARRHLYFEVDEWRAMPWWKTRLYTEGLISEFTPCEEGVEEISQEEAGIRWG